MNRVLWAVLLVVLSARPVFANNFVRYDASLQAIAVETYAGGYGHRIDIDFDSDHSGAGLISQYLWHFEYGYVTYCGVYNATFYEDGGVLENYGWSDEPLGSMAPVYDYSSLVNAIWDESPALQPVQYLTPEWNVSQGKTVVYVQAATTTQSIPVTEAMLAHTFIRVDEGPWYQFDEVPSARTPLKVSVRVSPSTVNATAGAPDVIAQIDLPPGYSADDLALDSVGLSIDSTVMAHGLPANSVSTGRKLTTAAGGGSKLIAKFNREWLLTLLPPGESTVYASGQLRDGTPIHGSTTLNVAR